MTTVTQATDCMTPSQLALAQTLVKRRIELDLGKTRDRDLCLPIKKIGDIEFDDGEILVKHGIHADIVSLNIDHFFIYGKLLTKDFHFTKETAKEDTLRILDFIKNMMFNKELNKYVDKRENEYTSPLTPTLWKEMFEECNEDVTTNWDDCCICKEITNTQLTECKHSVCLSCCSRLKPKQELEAEVWSFKCPLCRAECSALPDYYNGRYVLECR